MRSVFVIWTRYTDLMAQFVYHMTGKSYTHAAISLDEDGISYYSFCFKGFCQETVEKYRRRGVQSSLRLRLEIPDELYEKLQKRLNLVAENAEDYQYTKLGAFCAIFHIPFHRQQRYFCSQFVAELLESAGVFHFSRPSYLCLPHHLLRELKNSGYSAEAVAGIV